MRYWLIMDFGARANVQRLFEWLDGMKAEECGLFAATFESDVFRDEVAAELSRVAGGGMRLYLIGRRAADRKLWGGFILGRRRSAQWEGYGPRALPPEEEEED